MNFQRAKNLFAGEQGGSLKSKLDMKSTIFTRVCTGNGFTGNGCYFSELQ